MPASNKVGTLKQTLTRHHQHLLPIAIAAYILSGLAIFLLLQGNPNDWAQFMRSDAAMAVFALYVIGGTIGFLVLYLKKEPKLLDASHKTLTTAFLIAIIIGAGAFTYLNATATPQNYKWMHDGLLYEQMGESFLINHEFIINGSYTHHFAPLYPIFLSAFYTFLPVHLATQIALEIIFIAALLVVFFITKKMYGTTPALITTALTTTIPAYIFFTSRNYAEPLVLIVYTLTIYFILESLKPGKENRIIIAGIIAALGFLTKSSLGYFFILTGVAGFLWRFAYMRWNVFKNKNYVAAIIIFLGLVGAWTVRNVALFWDGTPVGLLSAAQPSEYMYKATLYAFTVDLGGFLFEALLFGGMSAFFFLTYIGFFADYLKKSFKRIREERVSCLLLSIALPIVLGVVISAGYFVYENFWMPGFWISYYPISQVRYVVYTLVRYFFIAIVPLSWLAYESVKNKDSHMQV